MAKIDFWKDKKNRKLDPTLFSIKAEALAMELAADCEKNRKRVNKGTQIRKFYDEVVRLDMEARARPDEWETVLPLVHMLIAKAAYAKGRDLVSDNFVNFVRSSVEQISSQDDLGVFANFFEAFMGFYKMHCPAN